MILAAFSTKEQMNHWRIYFSWTQGSIFRGDGEIADARADASSGRVIARTLVEQRFRKNTRTKASCNDSEAFIAHRSLLRRAILTDVESCERKMRRTLLSSPRESCNASMVASELPFTSSADKGGHDSDRTSLSTRLGLGS